MTYWTKGVRAVAIVVGVKGLLAFLGVILVLTIGIHHVDTGSVVGKLLAFVHIGPHSALARWILPFIEKWVGKIHNHRSLLAVMGFSYGTLKLVEGAGLWFEKRWAEWMVLVSTAVLFLPAEIDELCRQVTWHMVAALVLSVLIIAAMGVFLYHSRKGKALVQGKP